MAYYHAIYSIHIAICNGAGRYRLFGSQGTGVAARNFQDVHKSIKAKRYDDNEAPAFERNDQNA